MMKKVICDSLMEDYNDFVNRYFEQIQSENDIALFPRCLGNYYYMNGGLVHEIRLEDNQVVDETFKSWSVEEKNFAMNVLSSRVW